MAERRESIAVVLKFMTKGANTVRSVAKRVNDDIERRAKRSYKARLQDARIGAGVSARGKVAAGAVGREAEIFRTTKTAMGAALPYGRAKEAKARLTEVQRDQRESLALERNAAMLELDKQGKAVKTKQAAIAKRHFEQRKKLAAKYGPSGPVLSFEKEALSRDAKRQAERQAKTYGAPAKAATKRRERVVEDFKMKRQEMLETQRMERMMAASELNKARAAKVTADVRKNAALGTQKMAGMEMKSMTAFTENTQLQKESMYGFGGVMGMSMDRYIAFNNAQKKFSTLAGRVGNRIRMMSHGMRGFKMELLSVMFFGMALQRMFMGLLQPALQVSGVFDIWGATMQILFLPTAMMVLGWVMSLMEWVGSLTKEQQGLINKLVQVGAVLSTLLMIIGTTGLGIGGLIIAFSSWGKALTWLKGGIIKFAKFLFTNPIGIALLLIVGAIVLVRYAWKNNLGRIRQNFAEFVLYLYKKMGWFKRNVVSNMIQAGVTAATRSYAKGVAAKWEYLDAVAEEQEELEAATASYVELQDEIDASRKANEAMTNANKAATTWTEKLNNVLGFENERLEDQSTKYEELGDTVAAYNYTSAASTAVTAQSNMAWIDKEIAKNQELFISRQKSVGAAVGGISSGTFWGPGMEEFTGSYENALNQFYDKVKPPSDLATGFSELPGLPKYELPSPGGQSFLPSSTRGSNIDNRTITVSVNPTINITEEIKSDVDMKRIKDELSEDWVRDIESRVRSA